VKGVLREPMSRFRSALVGPLVAAGAVLALAGTGVALASVHARRAQLRGFTCQRALDPPSRQVEVTAVMRPVAGTEHMQLRFDLQARLAGRSHLEAITAGGLARWLSPSIPTLGQRPGDHWVLRKLVADLAAGAYRFVVSFRWLGAGGKLLAQRTLRSGFCHQPELRPDLAVLSFTAQTDAGHPQQNRYVVVIANLGRTAAGSFQVSFSDDTVLETRGLSGLAAHARRSLTFVGPACQAASPPKVVVDPLDQVDDYNRANNTASADCHAATPAPVSGQVRPLDS
jgi:hypothetical protein